MAEIIYIDYFIGTKIVRTECNSVLNKLNVEIL